MKITELRIGNLVQASWKKTTHQVSCHTFVEINEFDHCYNPIPLTEEWLERFGLKKIISQGSIFKLGEFHIQNFGPLGFSSILIYTYGIRSFGAGLVPGSRSPIRIANTLCAMDSGSL